MDLKQTLSTLAEVTGVDIKDALSRIGNIQQIDASLNSQDIVSAINVILAAIPGSFDGLIDDAQIGLNTAYSSNKIVQLLNTAVDQLKADAPEAFDTLKEMSDYIAADQTQTASLLAGLNNRLRFDITQEVTAVQQGRMWQSLNLQLADIDVSAIYTEERDPPPAEFLVSGTALPSGGSDSDRKISFTLEGQGAVVCDWGFGAPQTLNLPIVVSKLYPVGVTSTFTLSGGDVTKIDIDGGYCLRTITELQGAVLAQVAYRYSRVLTSVPEIPPSVTSLDQAFRGCLSFNQNISNWDTSAVNNMLAMFEGASAFNQNLSSWDVHRIPSKPASFDANTPAWVKSGRLPVWGTTGSH